MLAIEWSGPATETAASSTERDMVLDVEESEAGVRFSQDVHRAGLGLLLLGSSISSAGTRAWVAAANISRNHVRD